MKIIITFFLLMSVIAVNSQESGTYTTSSSTMLQRSKSTYEILKQVEKNYTNLEIKLENFYLDKGIGKIFILDDDRNQYFIFTLHSLINTDIMKNEGTDIYTFEYLAMTGKTSATLTLYYTLSTNHKKLHAMLIETNGGNNTTVQDIFVNIVRIK